MKIITEVQAYEMYLDENWDEIVPFKSFPVFDFIDVLETRGIIVVEELDNNEEE